jgi:hypothetical protein
LGSEGIPTRLPELNQSGLRFVDGRPVSAIATQSLEWCCPKLAAIVAAIGKKAWVTDRGKRKLAGISREVKRWIGKRNRKVKKQRQ